VTPGEIAGALGRLREAGAELRRRDHEQTLAQLAGLLDDWCDPRFPWRFRLEEELPPATGFSPAVVREGLARGLSVWSGDALRGAVERELSAASGSQVVGFETTSVLLAGAIPTPTLLSLMLPLLLHSPVLAKTSSGDPLTAHLFARSLAERDSLLGRCLEVVSFPGDDADCTAAFLSAACVVASGSDETMAAIAAGVGPRQRLVAHGHRLSLAVAGPAALEPDRVHDLAGRLALDTALWDQLGCLSPVAVYAVDPTGEGASRLAAALADALASVEKDLPRGSVPIEAAAAIARERSLAEMRTTQADRRSARSEPKASEGGPPQGWPVSVYRSPGTAWSVVLEADAAPRAAPLHRFLRVHPVAERGELTEALSPLSPHLAAVAVEGFEVDEERALVRVLAELGASRVCRPGALQAPPLDWHRDGLPLLLPLARICDLEP
jgi:hypothetical protein